MTSTIPVDVPGYIDLSGASGNYASMDRTVLSSLTTWEIIVRVRLDGTTGPLFAWRGDAGYFRVVAGVPQIRFLTASAALIGAVCPAVIPTGYVGKDLWLRGKLTIASGLSEYWYTYEETPATWTSLGTASAGGGGTVQLDHSDTVMLGSGLSGNLYYVEEKVSGTTVFKFDGTADLAGVPDTADTLVPSIAPTNALLTIHRQQVATGQGYVSLPGTVGNYLSLPSVAAATTAVTFISRVRLTDSSPLYVDMSLVSRMYTSGQYTYKVSMAPDGSIIASVSSNGTSITQVVPATVSPLPQGQWVWLNVTLRVSAGTGTVWYSTKDSLTPPTAADWSVLTELPTVPTANLHSSTDLLLIGSSSPGAVGFSGDIGYLGIWNTAGATPEPSGSAVFRLDASTLANVEADETTIPTDWGDLTVYRTDTPKDTGYIDFPGTSANYLEIPDAPAFDVTGSMCIAAGVIPYSYRPAGGMGIIGKNAGAGARSYGFHLSFGGYLTFYYSNNGTDVITVQSTQRVPNYGIDHKLFVGMSTLASTTRLTRFWTSPDRINWTELGVVVSSTPVNIFASATPVTIGSFGGGATPFRGRITDVVVNSGVGVGNTMTGGVGSVELLRMGAQHLEIDDDATSIVLSGGTATVHRDPVPVDFGVFHFPGTALNNLSIPDSVPLRLTDDMATEVRIAPDDWTPPNDDRLLMSKSGTSGNFGWQFLLTPRGTLKFRWSANGTTWSEAESVAVGLRDFYATRAAFTYDNPVGKFWLGDDNVNWTQLGGNVTLSGTIHASTAPVIIGASYLGALTNASLRSGFLTAGGPPVRATEVLLIDETCLDIDAGAATFVATSGQTVTINRDPTPVIPGWVSFPGTDGNFLFTSASAPTILGPEVTFIFRLAPDLWTRDFYPPEEEGDDPIRPPSQALWGCWGDDKQFLMELTAEATFEFSWSGNGTNEAVRMLASPPVPDSVAGEFRYLAITVKLDATDPTLRMFESLDWGNNWTAIGSPVTRADGDASLFNGASVFYIGTLDGVDEFFSGRLSYLDIRNGVDDTTGLPAGSSLFRIDAPALDVPSDSTSFPDALSTTVTVESNPTPTTPGYIEFKGKTGEYLTVPVPEWTGTDDFSIIFRANLDVDHEDEGWIIFQRWITADRSVILRKAAGSNKLRLLLSDDGTTTAADVTCGEEWLAGWAWYSVTVEYGVAAVVRFWTTDDVLEPNGTVLPPVIGDWMPCGGATTVSGVTALHHSAAAVLIGGDGAAGAMLGLISDLYVVESVATGGRPGGTGDVPFGFGLNAFYLLDPSSDAFLADSGQTVAVMPAGVTDLTLHPTPGGALTYISRSPDGPVVTLLPAPPGPVLIIEPSTAGPVTALVPSPAQPGLDLVSPSLDRGWWPGSENEDTSRWWAQPAFTVQRTIQGVVGGGDYVRGSTSTRTQATALRYPTSLTGWTAAGIGKGLLFARPYPGSRSKPGDPYKIVEIEWNVPQELIDSDVWGEVCIVRSAFGNPSTVNDGQVVYRESKESLFPQGYIFTTDGMLATPNKYDPHDYEDSGGQHGLPAGRWYYYGLFFRIGTQWVRSMSTNVVLPRNTGHSDHLWNLLPPYYRYLDDNQRGGAGDGDLKRFLRIFGFELDYTRELVENWQDLYHTDFTPTPLLRRIGDNFGAPYEPGIGDIRYRALISRIGFLYRSRGTRGGLRGLVAALSKCDCDLTMSDNVLLLPDDSDFHTGTGNWAGIHPVSLPLITGPTVPASPLSADKIRLGFGIYNQPLPDDGRGAMHVWTLAADATRNLIITCGDGQIYSYDTQGDTDPTNDTLDSPIPKTVLPRFTSHPVNEGDIYGFSISVRVDVVGPVARCGLIFFGDVGDADDVISTEVDATPASPVNTTTWVETAMQAEVPAGALYAVPVVFLTNRSGTSATYPAVTPYIHLSGAQLYYQGTPETVSATEPDRYLTLNKGTEYIGPPTTSPAFPGYLLGDNPETLT